MKSKLYFLAGLLLGVMVITCTGAAAAVSETVTAKVTTSPIYLDGEQVTLEGYNIGGHNYFKLRDIGALLGFNVYWSEGGVQIQSNTAYTGRAPETESGMDQVLQQVINQVNAVREREGVPRLLTNQALMDAAQECANRKYTWHHNREECEAVADAGYPYGCGSNLTVFSGAATTQIAERAVTNWIQSPGHYQTMIDPSYDSIGVGVKVDQGVTYCYLFLGNPNSVNPYG